MLGDGPFLLLIDAESTIERELIKGWIERNQPEGTRVDTAYIPAGRMVRRRARTDPRLAARLDQDDDPVMIPLRVVWLAGQRGEGRGVSLKDVLMFGDPRDPNLLRQRWIRTMHPDRIRIIVAEPGTKSDLEVRWQDPSGRGPAEGTSLAEFVALKAWIARDPGQLIACASLYGIAFVPPYLCMMAHQGWPGFGWKELDRGREIHFRW